MSEKDARGILLQVLSALRLLDSKGIRIYGEDLRCSRLLIRCGEVRITSPILLPPQLRRGGRGRHWLRSTGHDSPAHGHSIHMSPSGETLPDEDVLGDAVGCVGVLLHELLFGRVPETPKTACSQESFAQLLPDLPKDVSAPCRQYLLRLLDRDRRPTIQDVYNDPFIVAARKR